MKLNFEIPKVGIAAEKLRQIFGAAPNEPREVKSPKLEKPQSNEFGWNDSMVRFREDHQKIYDHGTNMGIQADVLIDGTEFEKIFDETLEALRKYVADSKESTGWNHLEDTNENWGKLKRVDLGGRTYEVIEETKKKDPEIPSVSIRAVRPEGKENKGGAYYFSGDGNKFSPRKIEICGAHMENVSEVLEDIKKILKFINAEKSE